MLPGWLTVLSFVRGCQRAWDATVIHTSAFIYLHLTSHTTGVVAAAAEDKKKRMYEAKISHIADFCPFAVETLGAFGPFRPLSRVHSRAAH